MVCGTNVQQTERSGKMRNCHRAATGFVVKKQLSLAAGEWLAGHSMLCMAAFRVAILTPEYPKTHATILSSQVWRVAMPATR